MLPEKKLTGQQIYHGRVVNLCVDTVEKPNGKRATREVVEHSACIAVVVLDNQHNVLLVRQFRYPVGKFLLEVPAGGIDAGEKPQDCVRRELQEEIGYLPRKIDRLGGFYSIPGYGTEYLHCYLATSLEPNRLVAEDTQGIELVRVPVSQIPQLIASGEICDAKSIAALKITDKMSKRWGTGTVVVPAPKEVDEIMRKVPAGKVTTINEIRAKLAQEHGATIGCPMTTGIFAWIAANAANEVAEEGKRDVTPYWRTLKSGGQLNGKYPGGVEAQTACLEKEGHVIEPGKGKKLPKVKDFEKHLAKL